MVNYPSNVVPYNRVRYNTPNAPTEDDVIVAYKLPADMVYLLTGAVSTLQDVNNWRVKGALSEQQTVDVFNNQVVRVDICDLIADCVRTSQDVQDAIDERTGGTAQTIINQTIYSNQTIIAGDLDANGCGNDAKFGRILALIDQIDTVMQDFFQSIDAATNIVQEISRLVSGIPLIETLPFDEVVAFIGATGEKWDDSYLASYNTQLRESFACQLWCAYGLSQCDITVKDVRQVLLERYDLVSTEGQLNALSAASILARLATTVAKAGGATYIGDDFVYISWLLQLSAVELSGQFFGVDLIDYAQAASNAGNNNGWSLCVCAPTPINRLYSFAQSTTDPITVVRGDYAPTPIQVSGTIVNPPSPNRIAIVDVDLEQLITVDSVDVTYSTSGNPPRTLRCVAYNGSSVVFDSTQNTPDIPGQAGTRLFNLGGVVADKLRLTVTAGQRVQTPGYYSMLRNATVVGSTI